MKPLVQKMWAIKYVGDNWTKPNFKLDGFNYTKKLAQAQRKKEYSTDFKVVRVEVRELEDK